MFSRPISYRDLEFAHAFRWCQEPDGRTALRWVPVGMPRLARDLERCVFFAFGRHFQKEEYVGPYGSGFFVAKQSETAPMTFHVYGVSNRHVVSQYPCIRVNKGAGVEFWDFEPTDWLWSETDDLAIVDVTDNLPFSEENAYYGTEIRFVMERDFVSEKFKRDYNIGIGDQTMMLGLLSNHAECNVNMPVGRFGNIAAVPSELAPIKLGSADAFRRPAWLNDTHSRGGFSGSPVWVWRSKFDDLSAFSEIGLQSSWYVEVPRQSFLGLLGCHRGQFREQTTIYSKEVDFVEIGKELRTGDSIELASSMTVVIPAWEISTLLDSPKMKVQRAQRDMRPERKRYSEAVLQILRSQEKGV